MSYEIRNRGEGEFARIVHRPDVTPDGGDFFRTFAEAKAALVLDTITDVADLCHFARWANQQTAPWGRKDYPGREDDA